MTTENTPDIVQSFDYYKDREYYKITSGFLFTYRHQVRTDRLKNWREWSIICKEMPDKILVNGKNYRLVEEITSLEDTAPSPL